MFLSATNLSSFSYLHKSWVSTLLKLNCYYSVSSSLLSCLNYSASFLSPTMTLSSSAIFPSKSPYVLSLLKNFLTSVSALLTPVAVLIFLKATYTTLNLSISLFILSRSSFSTKRWHRYTLYQFFSSLLLSWRVFSATSYIYCLLISPPVTRYSFYASIPYILCMWASLYLFSASRWLSNLPLNFSVLSSYSFCF